jgi:hypothetical protein
MSPDNLGHGHVISGVAPGAVSDILAQPLPYTWLSLNRYAQILGIAPCNFNTAIATPFFPSGEACQDVFYRYPWQNSGRISHEELVAAIYQAEQDIATAVGFPLAPS